MWKTLIALLLVVSLYPASASPLRIVSPEAGVDVSTEKVAYLTSGIFEPLFLQFSAEVLGTMNLPGPRLIIINSHGGDTTAGDAIIRMIEAEKSLGVRQICVVDRYADSMAFNILTHCDTRLATPGARMLMHNVAAQGINCYTARCTARYLREQSAVLNESDERYRQDNSRALGISPAEYDMYADNEHIWRVPALLKLHYLHGQIPAAK